jgi:hypothetical protein
VRDIRAPRRRDLPLCPRCWRSLTKRLVWSPARYAELLGFYLGDGCISRVGRTYSLRLSLDPAFPEVASRAATLLAETFAGNRVNRVRADAGATLVLCVYSSHMTCLFPQHGPGKKHERRIALEPWQSAAVAAHPWAFIRGCLWTDGCSFVNRTGRYAYRSWDFCNSSSDIQMLFSSACRSVGVRHRVNGTRIRIYRRPSVALVDAHVGEKR